MTELVEVSGAEYNSLPTERVIRRIDPSDGLFDSWLTVRQAFMEQRGWHYGDDRDEYDHDPLTIQLLNTRGTEIESGLRLTYRPDIEQTMTWSWLPPELQEAARATMPETPHGVWDLTRLVPGVVTPDRAIATMAELFGAGYEATRQYTASPRWVFATTIPFYRHFERQGIGFTPIVRGKFQPDDTHESILCYADPMLRTEYLWESDDRQHGMTRSAVERGRAGIQMERLS